MLLKQIISFFLRIPDLVDLFIKIDDRIQKEEEKNKISDDEKKINEAFKNKDAQKLRDTFNSD